MMMVVLGLMLSWSDGLSDITRYTFNNMNLTDGLLY